MEFYQSVLGGELAVSTFADFGQADDPAEADKVMHSLLEAPNGLVLMGADTPASMSYTAPPGVSISLSGDDDGALRRYWEALSASGTVVEPLEVAPWGDAFGMCVDRYGITWMVNIAGSAA
jgi:PhnB protein